jgi:NADH:quinone reductase (non-electrogenic)
VVCARSRHRYNRDHDVAPVDLHLERTLRILILGAGFAGVATARALERRLRADEAEITIVGRDNFSLFTPMLPEVSAGGLETRHIVTPVRAELRRTQFVLADVTAIDLDAHTVEVAHSITGAKQTLNYEQLVLALGSVTSTFGIPGVAEHALPLKTLEDAERLRNRAIASLELADVTSDPAERARLLTFVIVGGGYTGVEGAGEWVDLFRSITPFYASIAHSDVRIVLLEAGPVLLAGLPPAMGRYTKKNLVSRGVELHVGDAVTSLDDRAIHLASGTVIPTATVLWSAGVRPTPVVRDLPLQHARNGGIVVNRDFSVPDRPGVWALGDCAWIPMKTAGEWYPMTAQHAIREGPALARNIAAVLHGQPTKPFDFTALGTMASLGARRGVASFANGFVITGFPAWVLWRAYYLSRLPGLDRKVRVALDWLLGLIFRRDIAEMRVYTHRSREHAASDAGLEAEPD